VLVHVHVDVMDTGAFSRANYPHFAGLTFLQLRQALRRLCASPAFAGLVLTEVSPDHGNRSRVRALDTGHRPGRFVTGCASNTATRELALRWPPVDPGH
jgi:arginase family enzyme